MLLIRKWLTDYLSKKVHSWWLCHHKTYVTWHDKCNSINKQKWKCWYETKAKVKIYDYRIYGQACMQKKNVLKSTFQLKIISSSSPIFNYWSQIRHPGMYIYMYVYLDEEDEMRIRWAQSFECLHLLLLSIS